MIVPSDIGSYTGLDIASNSVAGLLCGPIMITQSIIIFLFSFLSFQDQIAACADKALIKFKTVKRRCSGRSGQGDSKKKPIYVTRKFELRGNLATGERFQVYLSELEILSLISMCLTVEFSSIIL